MKKYKMMKGEKEGGLLVLAGLFIGIGVGMAFGAPASGALIGLGVGFIAAYVAAVIKKK